MKQNYNKPIKNISEQIELLKQRGLKIEDIKYAEKHLKIIGYYRLSIYFKEFQIKSISNKKNVTINKFIPGTTFEDIIKLYNFDRKLRLYCLNIIEKIENSLKAVIVDEITIISNNFFDYINKTSIYNPSNNKQLKKTKESIEKMFTDPQSKDHKIIKNFNLKYTGELPVHMFINLLTFGNLIKFFKRLNDNLKTSVIQNFGYSDIENFINEITKIKNIRNICSHHDLLFSEIIIEEGLTKLDFKEDIEILFKFKNELFLKSHIDKDIIQHYFNNKNLLPIINNSQKYFFKKTHYKLFKYLLYKIKKVKN